jgi:8-oxo-dGTP pyrophosphatase MutT (NUDIX family)
MRWHIHGETEAWGNRWLSVRKLDVEQPDGERIDYHAVRLKHVAAAVVIDADERVLLMWRHRFLTDRWAWELPMGLIEPGESPAEAAAREVEEETGWRVSGLEELVYSEPAAGIMDSAHHVFRATSAVRIGEPTERNESDRIEWIPLTEVPAMIARREIVSGITLVGLQQTLLTPPFIRPVFTSSGGPDSPGTAAEG